MIELADRGFEQSDSSDLVSHSVARSMHNYHEAKTVRIPDHVPASAGGLNKTSKHSHLPSCSLIHLQSHRLGPRDSQTLLPSSSKRNWRVSRHRLNTSSHAAHLLRASSPQRRSRRMRRVYGQRCRAVHQNRCQPGPPKNTI